MTYVIVSNKTPRLLKFADLPVFTYFVKAGVDTDTEEVVVYMKTGEVSLDSTGVVMNAVKFDTPGCLTRFGGDTWVLPVKLDAIRVSLLFEDQFGE